jgi:hypothetical protein
MTPLLAVLMIIARRASSWLSKKPPLSAFRAFPYFLASSSQRLFGGLFFGAIGSRYLFSLSDPE